jgi:hypothetical protein
LAVVLVVLRMMLLLLPVRLLLLLCLLLLLLLLVVGSLVREDLMHDWVSLVFLGCCWPACSNSPDAEPLPRVVKGD